MEISTIQRRIGMIQKLQQEIKISKDALRQSLEDDENYVAMNTAAKDAASKKKVIKDQIWNQPQNRALLEDVKVNNEEVDTLQQILNQELVEYARANNTDEIEDESGNMIKFKIIAKLQQRGYVEQP